MTGPITFDPIPYPTLAMPCDGYDGFNDIANVAATDYAKVNTYLGSNLLQHAYVGYSAQTAKLASNNNNTWSNFPSGNWAPATFTVPAKALAVLIVLNGYLYATENHNAGTHLAYKLSGTGITARPEEAQILVAISFAAVETSRSRLYTTSEITPGQPFTIQPTYDFVSTAGSIDNGLIQVFAWVTP